MFALHNEFVIEVWNKFALKFSLYAKIIFNRISSNRFIYNNYKHTLTVDGCKPLSAPSVSGSSPNSMPVGRMQHASNNSPGTLLQNMLQARSGSVAMSQVSPLLVNTTGSGRLAGGSTSSPLPPSPADSGVSDVDSHYSSTDEHQQLGAQYAYFYHRSNCKF